LKFVAPKAAFPLWKPLYRFGARSAVVLLVVWGFSQAAAVKETNKVMSGRPALIRDCKQIINAAKKAGAKGVEFRIGNVPVIVHLSEEGPDDGNNSFDKIMRAK
jgi:hypothetical protein